MKVLFFLANCGSKFVKIWESVVVRNIAVYEISGVASVKRTATKTCNFPEWVVSVPNFARILTMLEW